MSNLTLGSLFDGSGGFPLGGIISGITPLWASEVEPFPIRVTTKRMPFLEHLGDVSEIDGRQIPPVDIITFGSPCQDMSIAGKREGLGGQRSGLFYEAVRIVKEMRDKTNGEKPRYIVWENVPGAFSSNKGEDFKEVLQEICSIGGYEADIPRPEKWANAGEIVAEDFSVAWRLLDAQYWGVPQRRSRIYLVADFNGGSAGKVLFESEGLSGDIKTCKRAWKASAGSSGEGTSKTGICIKPALFENHGQDSRYTGPLDVAQTVLATFGTGGNNQPFVVAGTFDVRLTSEGTKNGRHNVYETGISRTVDTGGNHPDSNQGGVAVVEAFGISSKDSNAMKSKNPSSGIYKAKTSRTLDTQGGNPGCNQGGMAVVSFSEKAAALNAADGPKGPSSQQLGNPEENFVCENSIAVIEGNGSRPSHKGDGYREGDKMYTLNATEQHAVAFEEKVFSIDRESFNCGRNFNRNLGIKDDGISPTLKATGPDAVGQKRYSSSKASFFTQAEEEKANTLVATDYKDPPLINDEDDTSEFIVRRLTPTECARLQGFPDWWCSSLETEEPSDEEIEFWRGVFETHRKVITGAKKPKTDTQIRKWLKSPHTDSAEYKMWGNGVALPNVVYVLTGISHYAT